MLHCLAGQVFHRLCVYVHLSLVHGMHSIFKNTVCSEQTVHSKWSQRKHTPWFNYCDVRAGNSFPSIVCPCPWNYKFASVKANFVLPNTICLPIWVSEKKTAGERMSNLICLPECLLHFMTHCTAGRAEGQSNSWCSAGRVKLTKAWFIAIRGCKIGRSYDHNCRNGNKQRAPENGKQCKGFQLSMIMNCQVVVSTSDEEPQ